MAEPLSSEEFERAVSIFLRSNTISAIVNDQMFSLLTIKVSRLERKITVLETSRDFVVIESELVPRLALDASPFPAPSKTPAES